MTSLLNYENSLLDSGITHICGVDEAGRGPLAGPLVVTAVEMPLDKTFDWVNDSKQIAKSKLQEYCEILTEHCISHKTVIVEHTVIDEINILNATKQAMCQAVNALEDVQFALVDAVKLDYVHCPTQAIIHGDALSYSIAAASIIAKFTRDEIMRAYDKIYPHYGFAKHKGYGTKAHIDALLKYGPCPIHRKSYIRKIFENAPKTIAYCGLACCVCSENTDCNGCIVGGCESHDRCKNFTCCREKGIRGCWECEAFPCSSSMLHNPRIRAFAEYVKEYGVAELTQNLLVNRTNGVVYHHEGKLTGDYDNKTKDEIFALINKGRCGRIER